MKKILLIIFLTAFLGGSAQAGLSTFTFEDGTLGGGDGSGAISDYMTTVYGSTVTVVGATVYPSSALDPLPALNSSNYIADAIPGAHQFTIDFAVPITYVSFNWARTDDPFKLEAIYAGGTVQVFSAETGVTNGGSGFGWEEIDLLAILGSPVTGLFFHDGGKGAIGIDNLVVNAVPLPASILLGAFAAGLAGWKFRMLL